MTLWHLPEDGIGRNPYGQLFTRSLEERGVTVVPLAYRHLFGLRALAGRPDIIHFQFITPYVLPAGPSRSWWRALVKGALFLTQVALLRLAGCRVVWTVHNLVNHEQRLATFEWFWTLLFARLAHRVIVHCQAARREVIGTFRLRRREDKIAVLFLPDYIDAYPNQLTRAEARDRLSIEAASVVILSLGQIRRYKGLPELVGAFHAMPGRARAELWIAGEPIDAALARDLEANASDDVHLRCRFLPPDEVELLLKACDVVALPYLNILSSGAALLAMSFGKACVAPRLGCLGEVLDDRGSFLYDPTDPDGLRNALARAVQSAADLSLMGRHNFTRVAAWNWPKAAEILVTLYEDLLGAKTQRAAGPGAT